MSSKNIYQDYGVMDTSAGLGSQNVVFGKVSGLASADAFQKKNNYFVPWKIDTPGRATDTQKAKTVDLFGSDTHSLKRKYVGSQESPFFTYKRPVIVGKNSNENCWQIVNPSVEESKNKENGSQTRLHEEHVRHEEDKEYSEYLRFTSLKICTKLTELCKPLVREIPEDLCFTSYSFALEKQIIEQEIASNMDSLHYDSDDPMDVDDDMEKIEELVSDSPTHEAVSHKHEFFLEKKIVKQPVQQLFKSYQKESGPVSCGKEQSTADKSKITESNQESSKMPLTVKSDSNIASADNVAKSSDSRNNNSESAFIISDEKVKTEDETDSTVSSSALEVVENEVIETILTMRSSLVDKKKEIVKDDSIIDLTSQEGNTEAIDTACENEDDTDKSEGGSEILKRLNSVEEIDKKECDDAPKAKINHESMNSIQSNGKIEEETGDSVTFREPNNFEKVLTELQQQHATSTRKLSEDSQKLRQDLEASNKLNTSLSSEIKELRQIVDGLQSQTKAFHVLKSNIHNMEKAFTYVKGKNEATLLESERLRQNVKFLSDTVGQLETEKADAQAKIRDVTEAAKNDSTNAKRLLKRAYEQVSGAENEAFRLQRVLQDETKKRNNLLSQAQTVRHKMREAVFQTDRFEKCVKSRIGDLDLKLKSLENKRQKLRKIWESKRLAKLKRETEGGDGRNSESCIVCFSNPISIVFVPCGHRSVCPECAPKILRCPICRQNVDMQVKSFDAGVLRP